MTIETIYSLTAKKEAAEANLDSIERWVIFFGLLVVIGVGGETIYGIRAWWNNRKLHAAEQSIDQLRQSEIAALMKSEAIFKLDMRNADARIAEAQRGAAEAQRSLAIAEQHSAEANAKTEGFRLDIAKANGSAKDAEARAAEANLALEQFKAPRTLSKLKRLSVAARLRKFEPQCVEVIIVGDGKEIAGITGPLLETVQQGGWTVNLVGKAISGPNVSGVLVSTRIGSDGTVDEAADALVSALQSVGIASERLTRQFAGELPMIVTGHGDPRNMAPIRILIGAKP